MPDSILVIENDPAVRNDLVSALVEAGYITTVVPDYKSALLKLNQFKADLVIVDDGTPEMDGKEICRHIRSNLDVPIVLLGEDNNDASWEKALEAEAILYEAKPLSYRVLIARLQATLRRCKASLRKTDDEISPERLTK